MSDNFQIKNSWTRLYLVRITCLKKLETCAYKSILRNRTLVLKNIVVFLIFNYKYVKDMQIKLSFKDSYLLEIILKYL